MPASGWKNRITSLGISIAANAAILGIMAGVLASPPKPADRMIAVELATPYPVRISKVQPSRLKSAVLPVTPKPISAKPRPEPPKEKPIPSIRPRFSLQSIFHPLRPKAEAPRIGHTPAPKGRDESPTAPAPRANGASASSSEGHVEGTASGAGTTSRGPGAPSVAGPGGSGGTLTRGGDGTKSVVAVADHKQEMRKPEPVQPKPEPPAPKGETRAAQPSKQPRPAYPSDARDEGIEGAVVLIATVGPDGKVSEVKIEKGSGDRRLDRAAEKGVRIWTYTPALKDGVAVKTTVRVRVEFKLE